MPWTKTSDVLMRRLRFYSLLGIPAVVCASLGSYHWFLELFSHFRVQYQIVFAFAVLISTWQRRWVFVAIFIGMSAINSLAFLEERQPAATDPGIVNAKYSLMLFNINARNREFQQVHDFIAGKSFDLVVLLELTRSAEHQLDLAKLGYEARVIETRSDNFGIGVYSRHPIRDSRILDLAGDGLPAIFAEIAIEDRPIKVLATHPMPPVTRAFAERRNLQLDRSGEFIKNWTETPALMIGDLNVTPWSPVFRRLLAASKFFDTRQGFGLQTTWPSWMPLVWIPIDHILNNRWIKILDRRIGPYLGSDHFPVLLSFSLVPR